MGEILVDKAVVSQKDVTTSAAEQKLEKLLKAMRPEFENIKIKTLPGRSMFEGPMSLSPFYTDGYKDGYFPALPVMLGEKQADVYNTVLTDSRFKSLRKGVEFIFLHEFGHGDTVNHSFDSGVTLVLNNREVSAHFGASELLAQQYAMGKLKNPVDAIASAIVIEIAASMANGYVSSQPVTKDRIRDVYKNDFEIHWSKVPAETVVMQGNAGHYHVILELIFEQNSAVMQNGKITLNVTGTPKFIYTDVQPDIPMRAKPSDALSDVVSLDPALFVPLGVPNFMPLTKDMEDKVVDAAFKKWNAVGTVLHAEAKNQIAADPEATALFKEIEAAMKEAELRKKMLRTNSPNYDAQGSMRIPQRMEGYA